MNFIQKIIDTYKKGQRFDSRVSYLNSEIEKLTSQLKTLTKEKSLLQSEFESLKEEYKAAKKLLRDYREKSKIDVLKYKDYYLYPTTRQKVMYNARRRGDVDIRTLFETESMEGIREEAHDIVKKGGLSSRNVGVDDMATRLYRHVNANWDWDYDTDTEKFKTLEYWMNPDDALEDKEGDCEDKTLAMHMVLREILKITDNEEHLFRIRTVAGNTLSGGHAFNIWLADDGEWYVMESTMDADGSFEKEWMKTPMRQDNFYRNVWFYTDPERSWRGDADNLNPKKVYKKYD